MDKTLDCIFKRFIVDIQGDCEHMSCYDLFFLYLFEGYIHFAVPVPSTFFFKIIKQCTYFIG